MKRVPQPPVQPALRSTEERSFWPGFVAVVAGFVLLLTGAQHLTGVETVKGASASETQLVKSFSSGGLQYASRQAPPPPPRIENNNPAAADALAQWQREQANAAPPKWKVRVDPGASTPCPT